jgi:hypothetical protein
MFNSKVSERITNKRKILRRSGEGEKGRCLPWSKEEEGAYIFWMKQVPVPLNLSYLVHAAYRMCYFQWNNWIWVDLIFPWRQMINIVVSSLIKWPWNKNQRFKVNIYPFLLPHFASIFFAYLWSFRWPNYIVTLPRYFSFRLPHLNISTRPPFLNQFKPDRKWLYPFHWLKFLISHIRWLFLSNLSEGRPGRYI